MHGAHYAKRNEPNFTILSTFTYIVCLFLLKVFLLYRHLLLCGNIHITWLRGPSRVDLSEDSGTAGVDPTCTFMTFDFCINAIVMH